MTNNVLELVRELRVDALYGKKKHYNAAERKQKYHTYIGISSLVANILAGSILFAFFSNEWSNWGKWIGALLSLITAAFIAIQTFFNFQKQVEGHRSIASRYLVVSKECNRVEAYFIDKHFDPESLREQLENLSRVCNQINNDADAFPTSNTDYRIAQQGLNDGEELYTVSEKQRKGE